MLFIVKGQSHLPPAHTIGLFDIRVRQESPLPCLICPSLREKKNDVLSVDLLVKALELYMET